MHSNCHNTHNEYSAYISRCCQQRDNSKLQRRRSSSKTRNPMTHVTSFQRSNKHTAGASQTLCRSCDYNSSFHLHCSCQQVQFFDQSLASDSCSFCSAYLVNDAQCNTCNTCVIKQNNKSNNESYCQCGEKLESIDDNPEDHTTHQHSKVCNSHNAILNRSQPFKNNSTRYIGFKFLIDDILAMGIDNAQKPSINDKVGLQNLIKVDQQTQNTVNLLINHNNEVTQKLSKPDTNANASTIDRTEKVKHVLCETIADVSEYTKVEMEQLPSLNTNSMSTYSQQRSENNCLEHNHKCNNDNDNFLLHNCNSARTQNDVGEHTACQSSYYEAITDNVRTLECKNKSSFNDTMNNANYHYLVDQCANKGDGFETEYNYKQIICENKLKANNSTKSQIIDFNNLPIQNATYPIVDHRKTYPGIGVSKQCKSTQTANVYSVKAPIKNVKVQLNNKDIDLDSCEDFNGENLNCCSSQVSAGLEKLNTIKLTLQLDMK